MIGGRIAVQLASIWMMLNYELDCSGSRVSCCFACSILLTRTFFDLFSSRNIKSMTISWNDPPRVHLYSCIGSVARHLEFYGSFSIIEMSIRGAWNFKGHPAEPFKR